MRRETFEKYVSAYCEELSKNSRDPHIFVRSRHASVITYNDRIISRGVNISLKHEFTHNFNELKCLHAEAVSIMRALRRHSSIISYCELWVCRYQRLGIIGNSRPCSMCRDIIKSVGIKSVHFTNDDGEWIECLTKDL